MGGADGRYRVILVDDEPMILRSLRAAIPWDELNLEVVGEAKSGDGALRLAREVSPHLIVSDIRMPGMDGITLLKELKADQERRLIVFISGYGEFEYAREALREGAFDYLLKPIDHEELTETISRAVKIIDQQTADDQMLHSVKMLSLLARERMLTEFIEGNRSPLQHMQWLEDSELEHGYIMAVVQLDHYLRLNEQWSLDEKRLWLFAVRNVLEEWCVLHGGLTVFPFRSGEWVLLFPNLNDERQVEIGRDLVDLIKRNTKLSCSVGFSANVKGIDQLGGAYELAVHALYQRFYSGEEGVYTGSAITDIPAEISSEAKYPKHLEIKIVESVRTLHKERLLELFDQTKAYIEEHGYNRDMTQRLLVELSVVVYRQFEHMQVLFEWSLEELLQELYTSDTLQQLMDAVKNRFSQWMTESRMAQSKANVRTVMGKAKEYIEDNYQKDLTIEEVSELADLSISHFCTLFKSTTGYTFLEYLTECRIKKAKSILLNSDVKVYQVAPLVGYQDPRYFTQVFKKITGQTPSEFREAVSHT
ncbi:response regulator [Paenibacillus sp. JCM 10914]|uniref:response regulator transcription factor n=1 Tax=Paenibacillus sp. JCM 10914 TaxID=1236974 RepID=UPI0003CC73B7|nr:response regulator [Paenibacillus sp. JCM 10914]GAE09483.1 helix-turn-helix, AraC type [Paenibacillus sp. JCM 10914]